MSGCKSMTAKISADCEQFTRSFSLTYSPVSRFCHRKSNRDRQTDTPRNRQTRQAGTQADRQKKTDKQVDRHSDIGGQAGREAHTEHTQSETVITQESNMVATLLPDL